MGDGAIEGSGAFVAPLGPDAAAEVERLTGEYLALPPDDTVVVRSTRTGPSDLLVAGRLAELYARYGSEEYRMAFHVDDGRIVLSAWVSDGPGGVDGDQVEGAGDTFTGAATAFLAGFEAFDAGVRAREAELAAEDDDE